ncbi:unnamed protein product [Porites evermanni]|uniref:Uncharacterized protein n=1 Tax=Porites evermanni TaxID=104178 RepID=A0ABN8STZ5_9CNID|nr:unnamed protein product [Porites evermanni]
MDVDDIDDNDNDDYDDDADNDVDDGDDDDEDAEDNADDDADDDDGADDDADDDANEMVSIRTVIFQEKSLARCVHGSYWRTSVDVKFLTTLPTCSRRKKKRH